MMEDKKSINFGWMADLLVIYLIICMFIGVFVNLNWIYSIIFT